jgi:hypothetical protein
VAGRCVLVVGAGAANLKSAVALNLAAALAASGVPTRLVDLDGASSGALRAFAPSDAGSDAWAVTLPWAAAALAVVAGTHPPAEQPDVTDVVDPPRRWDAGVQALAAAAAVVLVPVDASALARRVLAEVAPVAGDRLRVVLARRLPRAADRWALVDQLEALAPDALSPVTVPMARAGGPVLYAPGTLAARAYARLAADVAGAAPVPRVNTSA